MKPNRKLRKPDTCSKLILDGIIGLTTKNSNGLASSTSNSSFAYTAGCVAVVYNTNSETQLYLMVSNRSPKTLTCVAVSHSGNVVAAGESGHHPAVLIWDCESLALVSELKGHHQYGVACMDFSPDGKHLVSIGFPQDGYLYLWDWRSRTLVTKLKACSSCSAVESVSFSADSKSIITVGNKHFKIWDVKSSTRTRAKTGVGSLTMHAKPVNLGRLKGLSFTSVTSVTLTNDNQDDEVVHIIALTDSGILCLLGSDLSIAKTVDLEVQKGFTLSASAMLIACSCSNGIVKLFTVDSLKFVKSLHHTEVKAYKKDDVVENGLIPSSTYPDAIACQFSTSQKLVVIYGDHNLYIWDIHDGYKATKSCVLVSHSSCIWDIKNLSCENMHDPQMACVARGCPGGISFTTCSSDGTIRLWDLALQPSLSPDTLPITTTSLVSAGIFELESVVSNVSFPGFRAVSVSSDGKYLAAGDCVGNLHIYNLQTCDYMCIEDAHAGEILSLSFSSPVKKLYASDIFIQNQYLLASGGKDCKIHLYDVKRNFTLIGSVEDHSAAVASVKLSASGCKILSCSVNTSLVLHDVDVSDNTCKISRCHAQLTSQGIIHDMAVDAMMEVVVTVGQDKRVEIVDIAAGKLIRSFKQDRDIGDPVKVGLDPSSSYIICAYSNKSICLYDFITGEMVARAFGHGEIITGLIFLPDCKHVVSVSSDGCVFVWKLPDPLCTKMLQNIKVDICPLSPMVQQGGICQIKIQEEDEQLCKTVLKNASQKLLCPGGGLQETSNFKFSISRLPKWAQEKVSSETHTPLRIDSSGSKHLRAVGSESSQISPRTSETNRTFALDNRWQTVHTVCLDLLNSPEVWSVRGMKKPLIISNMPEHTSEVTTSDASCTNNCKYDEAAEKLKSETAESTTRTYTNQEEIITACREALLNLDALSESALKLFSKLGKMDCKVENTRENDAQLYTEATELLPSIAKKVHAISKLTQSSMQNSGSGETGMDLLGFEPFLGSFAESLSQRVVEILKKNCSTL